MSQLFTYRCSTVRTISENGDVWFAAVDVCKALGISWSGSKILRGFPDDWQRVVKLATLRRGEQETVVISEPAVYKLAFRSNKPEADAFTNWVASEVLPAIRKTGKFEGAPRHSCKALPAAEQLAMPAPGKDKFVAYIEQVEEFRARTTEEISRLLQEGLGLVDVYKFGPKGITGFTHIFLNWLHEVAVSPSPLFAHYWSMERAIEYSPLHLIRELEKILPDCRCK